MTGDASSIEMLETATQARYLRLMSDVTQILAQIEHGNAAAADQLLPLVYDELRKLAAARLKHEKPGQTLQATALVHDPKSVRLDEKIREARAKGYKSLKAKMWGYSGLSESPYNIFDFRVSRHRDGPEDFFRGSRCKVQGDCFSGNQSVVLRSDGRLEFVACWSHARRKVADALTYEKESEQLVGMIQALYDIETRAMEYSADQRQSLRERDSVAVLNSIAKWLDSPVVAEVLPKSDFGEALRYIRNHCARFERVRRGWSDTD